MKNKIKKLKLPLNKMTGNEKDYIITLLKNINSNMKAFLNVLSGEVVTNEKLDSAKKKKNLLFLNLKSSG